MKNEDRMIVATAEAQGMLRELSRTNPDFEPIYIDGIYGSETEAAVAAFQRHYAMPITGRIDYPTWRKLRAVYNDSVFLLLPPRAPDIFFTVFEGGTLSPGDRFDTIYVLQHMLTTLSVPFDDFDEIMLTGVYDASTERAVRAFQGANGISVTGEVDILTWNRLTDAYNAYISYE